MKIEWTRVTWYSQLIALILFIGIFGIGIWLGMQIKLSNSISINRSIVQQAAAKIPSPVPANTVATYKCSSGEEIQETYSDNMVSIEANGTASSSSAYVNCKQIAAPIGL